MALTEDDEMVETLVLDRLDPAIDEHVLVRRMGSGWDHSCPGVLQDLFELSDIHSVPVASDVVDAGPFDARTLRETPRLGVLVEFYTRTRPWGRWQPVHQLAVDRDPGFQANRDFGRDDLNVIVDTVWRTGCWCCRSTS